MHKHKCILQRNKSKRNWKWKLLCEIFIKTLDFSEETKN